MSSISKIYTILGQSSISYRELNHDNIIDCVSSLYQLMEQNREETINNLKIVCYYGGVPITVYQLAYDHGLILHNSHNYIQVSSLFPEIKAIDLLLGELITKEILHSSKPIKPAIQETTPMNSLLNAPQETKPRHAKMYNRFETAKKMQQIKSEESSPIKKNKAKFDEEFENKKENERNIKILENRTNEKFRMFVSDKKSYQNIKQDIEKGLLKPENMHPYFLPKYQIFKILESRNALDFSSNDKIKEEYEIFSQLYNSYLEENEEDSTCKVYIPHKYHYMTREEKEEYAKKYKMTLESFEEKYINNTCNYDKIDTYINKNTLTETKPKTETTNVNKIEDSSEESSYSSDSEDDTVPGIDPKFIELTKEYNNK